jgi:hypothetical protein
LREGHDRYFDQKMPDDATTLSDPAQAVSYLEQISPEMRGCAILDADGRVLAASGEDDQAWERSAAELLDAADVARGEPADHVHVATGDGEVFCVRHAGRIAVAVAERFVLSSLMLFDLRAVLRELDGGQG